MRPTAFMLLMPSIAIITMSLVKVRNALFTAITRSRAMGALFQALVPICRV